MYPKMQDLVQIPTTCTRNGAWVQGRESERLVPAMVERYKAMAASGVRSKFRVGAAKARGRGGIDDECPH